MSENADEIDAPGEPDDEFQEDIAPADTGQWFTAGDTGGAGKPPAVATTALAGDEPDDMPDRVDELERMMSHVKENLFPLDPPVPVSGDVFYVALTKTGGTDGGKTFGPSYTYSGTVNGTVTSGLTPAFRLHGVGRFIEATGGLGRLVGGTVTLLLAFEQRRQVGC